jgi:transcription antitermination factor NusG
MENALPDFDASWYALSTRSRQEKAAASTLNRLGIPHFLPLVSEVRQWTDRKQIVDFPLFPGYLFVKVPENPDAQLAVLKVPGVVRYVGNRFGPQAIPEEEIRAVRTVLAHRTPCTQYPFPKVGERVIVVRGPLTGIEGTLVRHGSEAKLLISVGIVQQSIAVVVSCSDVEPISHVAQFPLPGLSHVQCPERAS